MGWIVYILRCADDTLYTGITNDLNARLLKHERGKGAKYTKGRGPFEVLFKEIYTDRSGALKKELHIKSLDKSKKLQLIAGNLHDQ